MRTKDYFEMQGSRNFRGPGGFSVSHSLPVIYIIYIKSDRDIRIRWETEVYREVVKHLILVRVYPVENEVGLR